ncbi:hypothetical protein ACFL3G_04755 [Planctomycetota bacterium]
MSNFDSDKCFEVMKKLHNKIKDKVIDTIYHYTNVKGFKGIVESNEIWMTNTLFVNDKTELRSLLQGSDVFKSVEFKNPKLFDAFKDKPREYGQEYTQNYYLASFSKGSNSLDQFRAYGNYCIGIDAKMLKKNSFSLFRCVYSQRDIKRWVVRQDNLKEWKNECFNDIKSEIYKDGAFAHIPYAARAKLKNKHYKSEKEIRLFVMANLSWESFPNSPEMFCDQPAIYFRNHNMFNAPVPYVKFFIPKNPKTRVELQKMVKNKSQIETKRIIRAMEMEQERELLPIKNIIIGPMQHQEEAVLAAKMFLYENGYENVEVKRSDIPFRGN